VIGSPLMPQLPLSRTQMSVTGPMKSRRVLASQRDGHRRPPLAPASTRVPFAAMTPDATPA